MGTSASFAREPSREEVWRERANDGLRENVSEGCGEVRWGGSIVTYKRTVSKLVDEGEGERAMEGSKLTVPENNESDKERETGRRAKEVEG